MTQKTVTFNIKYYTILKESKDNFWIREKLIKYALAYGNKPAAREFNTTVKTVRKWVKRYLAKGEEGLKDRSRRPNKMPNKMDEKYERKIIELCEKKAKRGKKVNASLIKRYLGIPYSVNAIKRVMKDYGYIKLNKPKKERKRDLREKKKAYKAFEKLQVDIKYLNDIPELFYEYKRYKLPKYQITARCVRTGALFISYLKKKHMNNAYVFIDKLLNHLESYGVKLKEIKIQTDNGREFVSVSKKKKSIFEKLIERRCKRHKSIPPGAKTWQSDVETSHKLIEDEFYAFEEFNSKEDFLMKSYRYVRYFNYKRHNSYKKGTPMEIIKEINPKLDVFGILDFKPIIVDNELNKYFNF